VNQEDSEQNEVDGMKKEVDGMKLKVYLLLCVKSLFWL